MASLNILFLGDIVGEPGRRAVIELLPVIREREGIDFVIVNGENSANGRGITPRISIDLLRAGAAVITDRGPRLGPEGNPRIHRHRAAPVAPS